MYTVNPSQPREAFLQHCKPTRKYKELEILSHWRGNMRAERDELPSRTHQSSPLVKLSVDPPRRAPRSSPLNPNNPEVVLRTYNREAVTTLHKLTKKITKRVGVMNWNNLGRENLCSHVDHLTRFLDTECSVQHVTTLAHPHRPWSPHDCDNSPKQWILSS